MEDDSDQGSNVPPVHQEPQESARQEHCMEPSESENRENETALEVTAPDNTLCGNDQSEECHHPITQNELGEEEEQEQMGGEEEPREEMREKEVQIHNQVQDGESAQEENENNEDDDKDEDGEKLVEEQDDDLEREKEKLEEGSHTLSIQAAEDHSSEAPHNQSTVPEEAVVDESDEVTLDPSLNSRPLGISDEGTYPQDPGQDQELQDRMLPSQGLQSSPYLHGVSPHLYPGQFHLPTSPFNQPAGSLPPPHFYNQHQFYNHPSPSFHDQQPALNQGGYYHGWFGHVGTPAFPGPQQGSCSTPPGSVRLIQPSSHMESAFSPPIGKDDESGPRSIKVRGFDSKMVAVEDALETYFSSKRKSGGGAIDTMEIKKKYAIITFERASVARHVVSKTDHTIKGKPVTVELCDPDVKEQIPVIKVTGLPPDLDDDHVEMYFESKRKSGGGEVKDLERKKGGKEAIITFTEMKVATQVVSKTDHVIRGNPVSVEFFDPDEDMPEQVPVIKVTGLPPCVEDDQVETYFESKRKSGGGEVVKVERRKGGRIAIVTFAEMEVAQRVVSKTDHVIKGNPVSVELFDPDEDMPEQVPVIKVTGLPSGMEDDQVKTHFESKRKSGGGEVLKVERRKGGRIAIITFRDMEDAKRVVEKGQHHIKKTKVDVCFWDEDGAGEEEEHGESSGAEIEVRGFKLSTTDEVVQMYFENKAKSGGGPVKSLKKNQKKGVIVITFDSPKVVESVISKRQHILEGKKLTVTAKKPSHTDSASGDDSGEEEFQSAEEGDEEVTSTVKVTGHLEEISKETLSLYFENQRKSGGGDLTSCTFNAKEQALLVTFLSPNVAQRVAEKKDHCVEGRKLTVRLHITPPSYKDRVLFEGVPESISHDTLLLFFENVSNQECSSVLYGDEPGTVLVFFPRDADFQTIQEKCSQKPLENQFVTPNRVEITCCILVKPVTHEITKTILELHFDNKNRSGGEGVEEVEMKPDMQMAIVKFADHKVAEQVASRKQEVLGKVLEVSLHHECLGLSGGTTDPTYFRIPEPLEMEGLDPFKIRYLQHLENTTTDLHTALSDVEAHLNPQALQRECLVLECSVPKDAKDGRRRTRNWTQRACKALENFLETLAVFELNVSHEIHKDVTVGVTSMLQEYPCFALVEHSTNLAVVGPQAEMASTKEHISKVIQEVQESHDRAKNLKEATMSVQTASKMDLLCMVGLPESVKEKHPKLEASFNAESQQVMLKGTDVEIMAAKLAIMELQEAMTFFTMSEFSNQQAALMSEKKAKAIVRSCLKKEGLKVSWERREGKLLVLTLTSADMERVQNLLKKTVLEVKVELDEEQKVLVKSKAWEKKIQQLGKDYQGMWIIGYEESKGILIIAAISEILPEVRQNVERFLKENAEYTDPFHAPGPRVKFLHLHKKDKVEQMQRKFEVKILFPQEGQLQIKGTKERIQQAREEVSTEIENIQVQTRKLNQFQIKKCLTKTQAGRQRVEELQNSQKCVINMEAADGKVVSEMQGEQDQEDRETMAVCTVPGTEVRIEVMDSTASQTSAEAMLVVLGREEEEELKTRVASFPKAKSLKESDVEWLPGAKGDKSLLVTKGPESGSFVEPDVTIKNLIEKALKAAEKHQVTRVAIPVETLIPSGTIINALEACRAVVESIQNFDSTSKTHSISRITLCYLKQEIQDLLVESLGVKFGRQSILKIEPDVSEEASELPPVDITGATPSAGPRIFLEKRDIVKEEPDVMINSTNTSLDLHQGQVSKALLELGGPELQDECKKSYPQGIKCGDIAVTPRVGKLLCRHFIYHIALQKWDPTTGEKTLSDYMVKILEKAAADKMISVAFPALGTGNLSYPRDIVAQSMYNGVTQFGTNNPQTSVKDVYFVVHPNDKDTIKAFEHEEKKRKGMLGVGAKPKQLCKSPVPKPRNPHRHSELASRDDSSLVVAVYAEDRGIIDEVFGRLMSISKNQIDATHANDSTLCKWKESEIKQLYGLRKHGVDVMVQLDPGRVELRGLQEDIMTAQGELHKIIRQVDEARQEKMKAENMANFIQWYFVEIGENGENLEKYDDVLVNYGIEMAYRDQKEKYALPGGDYFIDFNKLMEFSAKGVEEEPLRVVRRDKVKEAKVGSPEEWEDMGSDLIKPVSLSESSDEYKRVVRNIERTMEGHPYEIVNIERVQNPELWSQYAAKRLQIEKNCPGKEYERTLWHGTNADSIHPIIMRGFNRSYCGKNETALGQGVYFAAKAHYSSREKYSPADNKGHKHMFQAKVLVGVPTPGTPEMRVLGPRDKAKSELFFDSAVDKVDGPEIFVIFNDTQAYPEYHIVFKV